MGAGPLATCADYALRYGEPESPERVGALLEDAAAMVLAAYRRHFGEAWEKGACPDFDDNAKAVCCAVVARAVNVPSGMFGVTQMTQTGGPYSESFTAANPTGDLYLTKSDLERLGLSGTRIWSIRPSLPMEEAQDDRP